MFVEASFLLWYWREIKPKFVPLKLLQKLTKYDAQVKSGEILDTLKKKKKSQICLDSTPMKHKKHPCGHYGGRRAMEQKKQLLRLIKSYNEWDGRGTKCRIYRSKNLTILKLKDKKLGVYACCWFHSYVYDRHDMNYKYYSSQFRGQHRLMMDWMMDSSQVERWENMCV